MPTLIRRLPFHLRLAATARERLVRTPHGTAMSTSAPEHAIPSTTATQSAPDASPSRPPPDQGEGQGQTPGERPAGPPGDCHSQQQQQQQQQGQELGGRLLLEDGSGRHDAPTTKLDLSGDGKAEAKLEHLGPLVVNEDGTLSRIANWTQMSEIERNNTLRVLGKRNQLRLARLRAAQDEEKGQRSGES